LVDWNFPIAGKSLDKIMELKQLAGNQDLYDVMRRQKRRQKTVDAKAAKMYKEAGGHAQSSGYVFDIINRKLNSSKTGIGRRRCDNYNRK